MSAFGAKRVCESAFRTQGKRSLRFRVDGYLLPAALMHNPPGGICRYGGGDDHPEHHQRQVSFLFCPGSRRHINPRLETTHKSHRLPNLCTLAVVPQQQTLCMVSGFLVGRSDPGEQECLAFDGDQLDFVGLIPGIGLFDHVRNGGDSYTDF